MIDKSKWVAIRSFPPLINATIMKVIDIAPRAVRFGALRGRSRRWCSRLSPIVVALIGSTTATLLQKRVGADIPLVAGTAYQYLFTGLVLGVIALATGNTHIVWSARFTAAFVWLVLVLSVGAILLLLWLLNSGSAASVSSLFYLVPPATAVEAFFLFGEKVNTQGFLGIGVTALGVWLVIRG